MMDTGFGVQEEPDFGLGVLLELLDHQPVAPGAGRPVDAFERVAVDIFAHPGGMVASMLTLAAGKALYLTSSHTTLPLQHPDLVRLLELLAPGLSPVPRRPKEMGLPKGKMSHIPSVLRVTRRTKPDSRRTFTTQTCFGYLRTLTRIP